MISEDVAVSSQETTNKINDASEAESQKPPTTFSTYEEIKFEENNNKQEEVTIKQSENGNHLAKSPGPTKRDQLTAEPSVKMAGYLEKRGKMKLVSQWRRYWFVLEGRLLLYYKSQQEYAQGLSACRGSLNMGLANAVRPGSGNHATSLIEIVTRTQILTLRTKDRGTQERWLQVLLHSMALPNVLPPLSKIPGTSHFRYSLDNLPTQPLEVEKVPSNGNRDNEILARLKRMGGQTYYGGGSLENILVLKTKSQANLPKIDAVQRILGRQNSSESFPGNNPNLEFLVENSIYQKRNDNILPIESEKKNNALINTENTLNEPELSSSVEYNEISPLSTEEHTLNMEIKNEQALKIENKESDNFIKRTAEASTNTENDYEEEDVYEFSSAPVSPREDVEKETKIEDDGDEEYIYYDTAAISKEICEEPEVPPRPREENENTHVKSKHKKKFKLKLKKRKSTRDLGELNEEVVAESPKRRLSFLSKMFRRNRHQSNKSNKSNEDEGVYNSPQADSSSDEPEYESVDYQAAMLGLPASKADESQVSIPRVPYFQHGWLTEAALAELSSKIKQNQMKAIDQESEKSWDELHSENIKNKENAEIKKLAKESPPPSLPPRRENPRPASPWHDVPTNNSPVDCDSEAFKESITKFAEWNLDIQDKILGTPEGFQLIKNKWKNVEQRSHWNKFQGQVSFPNKLQSNTQMPKDDKNEEILVKSVDKVSTIPVRDMIEKYEQIPLKKEINQGKGNIEKKDEGNEDKESIGSDESLIDSLNTSSQMGDNECDRDSIEPEIVALPKLIDIPEENNNGHRPRYSDELNVLLSQLAEISSAPVLKPGVTCSLVEVGVTAILGPPRRRRHSDPDYDIPRSIKAIMDDNKEEEELNNDKNEFFEGNLDSSKVVVDSGTSWNISMTPDSLEPMPLY